MRVKITCRHMDLTDALRDYAEKKVGKVSKFYNRLSDIDLVIDNEGTSNKVEIILKADNHQPFVVNESSEDVYACIDSAVDKIERQLKKFKEKSRNHKGNSGAGEAAADKIDNAQQESA